MATIASTNFVLCGLDLNKSTCCFHISDNSLAAFHKVHTLVLTCSFVHKTVVSHYVKYGKITSKTNFKVVGVVCRCDFNRTCTLIHLSVCISYDGDFSADYGDNNHLTDDILISFVVGMYSNTCITRDSFRTSCSNFDITCAINKGIS